MISTLIGWYRPRYLTALVYMFQSTEYQILPFLRWCWRTKDFDAVMYRRKLDPTRAARLLLLALRVGVVLQLAAAAALIIFGSTGHIIGGVSFGLALAISYPIIWPHLLVVPVLAGRILITQPRERQLVTDSEKIFAEHPGVKIAVAGSYGKTTMKELLRTVLSEALVVAATPANKNVSLSHATFATQLKGNEDIIIIEYGEAAPGDVARFAAITHPTHAVITGLAPAHLDQYKSLQAAGEDIFSLVRYVKNKHFYVNIASKSVAPFIKDSYQTFDTTEALGWKVHKVQIDIDKTSFTLKKGKREIALESQLIGRHQVGFLAFVAALGIDLGLSDKQIKSGIAKTTPFEHRMQPYQLNDAWIIDDSYNGNIEGIRAGTLLLKELTAKRKIYVTPGLVEQGDEKPRVHREMGQLIADANPDVVVLMQNSTTNYIEAGLKEAKFSGEVRHETDPLAFYANLNQFVANGDLVLLQNDWTDNYV